MDAIIVTGGAPLSGEIRVGGAKNSALKLMAASLLAPGVTTLRNVPDIADIAVMAELLQGLGVRVVRTDHALTVDAATVGSAEAPYDMVARMRASISVLGALVARMGRAHVAMPGGCNIGSRKVDMHLKGLEALGAQVTVGHGYITAAAPEGGLVGAPVSLDFPSVGATENLLMAAATARGTTVIDNAAREPEIVDLVRFLQEMGARITGEGTTVIEVQGVEGLAPVEHVVVGDRIEAGTYVIAGALDGGPVTVRGFDPSHLEIVLAKLAEAGVDVERLLDGVVVSRSGPLLPVDVATLPYPGFPTDLQAPWMTLMSVAHGTSVVTENVFENRFMFADELSRMGADIRIDGHAALIKGVPLLVRRSGQEPRPARRRRARHRGPGRGRRDHDHGRLPCRTWLRVLPREARRARRPRSAPIARRGPPGPAARPTQGGGHMPDIDEIMATIPHRYPFLLVDRILEHEPGVSAVGIKNVTMNEWFFQGHFPEFPVMPGVLIIEALAQVGAFALLSQEEYAGKLAFFGGLTRCASSGRSGPVTTLRLECEISRMRAGVGFGNAKATVDGELVCSGELMFAVR